MLSAALPRELPGLKTRQNVYPRRITSYFRSSHGQRFLIKKRSGTRYLPHDRRDPVSIPQDRVPLHAEQLGPFTLSIRPAERPYLDHMGAILSFRLTSVP